MIPPIHMNRLYSPKVAYHIHTYCTFTIKTCDSESQGQGNKKTIKLLIQIMSEVRIWATASHFSTLAIKILNASTNYNCYCN